MKNAANPMGDFRVCYQQKDRTMLKYLSIKNLNQKQLKCWWILPADQRVWLQTQAQIVRLTCSSKQKLWTSHLLRPCYLKRHKDESKR